MCLVVCSGLLLNPHVTYRKWE